MNPEGTKINGMISVCSGKNGNARLGYEIDLASNEVTYILEVHRRDRASDDPERRPQWRDYADVAAAYEVACDIVTKGYCDRIVERKEVGA